MSLIECIKKDKNLRVHYEDKNSIHVSLTRWSRSPLFWHPVLGYTRHKNNLKLTRIVNWEKSILLELSLFFCLLIFIESIIIREQPRVSLINAVYLFVMLGKVAFLLLAIFITNRRTNRAIRNLKN